MKIEVTRLNLSLEPVRLDARTVMLRVDVKGVGINKQFTSYLDHDDTSSRFDQMLDFAVREVKENVRSHSDATQP